MPDVIVAGVDGCDAGWIVVRASIDHNSHRVSSVNVRFTFAEVLSITGDCQAIAIDIPVGLSDDGRRKADVEARKILSPLRHNSVFPAPVRAVLGAPDYREACSISARVRPDGKKISKQTFSLSHKIADVDRVMSTDPSLQTRVVEIHPEVCFWAMNGAKPLRDHKKTSDGKAERLQLLASIFLDRLQDIDLPAGAARDDLYDACAAVWTAGRVAHGAQGRLPPEPQVDSRGLRMEIVY